MLIYKKALQSVKNLEATELEHQQSEIAFGLEQIQLL